MSIDGISKGGYMPLPTGPDASQAGTAGKSGATAALQEAGFMQVARPSEALDKILSSSAGSSSAGGLKTPAELDKKMAAESSSSLGTLSGEDVTADIYSFMALFQKISQSMRDTARTERSTALQGQVASMQSAADQMKTTAALRFAAGVVSGSMQIAGGVMQAGLSAASAASTIKGANMDAAGKNNLARVEYGAQSPNIKKSLTIVGNNQIKQGAGFTATGTAQGGQAQAASAVAGGLGSVVATSINYAADLSDAKKAQFDIQAKVQETAGQHANDMMQQMMDVIRDVRDKLQSIQQAAVETNRGIARNI